MRAANLDQLLTLPNLPSLPDVALKVLELTADDDAGIKDIAQAIECDQGLCARVLKTVNSPYYGLTQPCPTLTRALMYLGLWTVKSLVLGFSLVDAARERARGFDLEAYWRRGILAAAAARRLARHTAAAAGANPDEAFLAALVQDIGMIALHTAVHEPYDELVADAGPHGVLAAAETSALGFDHPAVSAGLAAKWRLPKHMVDAIRFHHDPGRAAGGGPLAQVLVVAACAAEVLSSDDPSEALASFASLSESWFSLTAEARTEFLEQTASDAAELGRALHVSAGEAPDIREIMAQAEEASLRHQIRVQRETDLLRHDCVRLAEQAWTDGLTGVGNRHSFDREIEKQFATAQEAGSPLAVILIDADCFKQLNDTMGHPAGDMVLVQMAARMRDVIRRRDGVYRYGGEEFVVLAPGAARPEAVRLAETLRQAIEHPDMDLRAAPGLGVTIPVTVSVGAAVFEPGSPASLATPLLLVDAADRALYAAKRAGRNCTRMFRPGGENRRRDASCAARA